MNWTLPELIQLISQLKTYTPDGWDAPMILERELKAALTEAGHLITDDEFNHHRLTGLLGQALFMNGFSNVVGGTYLENIPEFRNGAGRYDWEATIIKEIFPLTGSLEAVALTEGLTIYTPVCIIDEGISNIVAIQMIGPEQSVKSNWAALVSGRKANWLNNCAVKLGGSKNHHTIRHILSKSGWAEYGVNT